MWQLLRRHCGSSGHPAVTPVVTGTIVPCAMAPRRARTRDRGSGTRVTGKFLKVQRTPHAFAIFLAHMKEFAQKYKKRRLNRKTIVMRMDLMTERYRSLPGHEKQSYVNKSLAFLQEKKQRQAKLLQAHRENRHAQPPASAVVEQAGQAQPVVEGSSAVAEQPGLAKTASEQDEASVLWLALPVPATSPTCDIGHAGSLDLEEPAPPAHEWPRRWEWTERPSGIQHSLRAEVHTLGAGSYGCCLAVKDTLTGEAYCLKVPRPTKQVDSESEGLKHEYRTLLKLNHCNVVRGIAWVESRHGDSHGFLMPMASGNLWQLVQGGSEPLTRGDGVSLLVQVARGLSHVHMAGLVHLDMKPENVLTDFVAGHHLARVADFGQSVPGPMRGRGAGRLVGSDTVNSQGYRPVHLLYAAGALVSAQYRFDTWAFGCIAFDVLQKHPRWRSAEGQAQRLFSGTSRSLEYLHILRLRNYRLTKMLESQVVALVLRCQGERGAHEGPMRVDLVRAITQLQG